MISRLKSYSKAAIHYLSDSRHTRAISTVVAILGAHFLGKAIDGDALALTLDAIVGGFAGQWTASAKSDAE